VRDARDIWRSIARAATALWFRDIEVVGRERMPQEGPTVLLGSHFNGLLDVALVTRISPRFPRFLAAAGLWGNPLFARLLDSAGALPVRRREEGSTKSNVSVFEACFAALADGSAIALFPEGTTHDEPRITMVRTGAARIALGAREGGVRGVRVVPMGLVYTAKATPRSRALVRIGDPIDLDADIDAYVHPGEEPGLANVEAVRRLTDDIQRRLADAALDYADADLALIGAHAAAVALRPAGASRHWEPSLDDIERCARALAEAPPELRRQVVRAFVDYNDTLTLLGVRDAHLVAGDLTPTALRWKLGRLAGAAVASPVAAVGLTVNGPALALMWLAGKLRYTSAMRGTARLITGLAALPATWTALRWAFARRGWREPTLASLAAGPGAGLVTLSLLERLRALRSARGSAARLREHEAVVPILWEERAGLVASIAEALAAAGEENLLPAGGRRPSPQGAERPAS
jgi:glycerol-3-phosphate O-acyltransferase/dihydroxyacetone phosphate acyltransferase